MVVTAFDSKTEDDIKNLNAGDFEAKLGKTSLPVIHATPASNDRVLVLLETDGTRSDKIEDVVNLATRLVRQAPEGKAMAFGAFVKRSVFTKGFIADPKERASAVSAVVEESSTLGKRAALYNALHKSLALFGAHQPGDAVLLITDGVDDASDYSREKVEKEFIASGTRLFVMLRQTPSHVSGDFLWSSPEHDISLMQRLSAETGGIYTMFSAQSFAFGWQGYLLEIKAPGANSRHHKLKLRLRGEAAETYHHPNLYYPERLPPCSSSIAAAR